LSTDSLLELIWEKREIRGWGILAAMNFTEPSLTAGIVSWTEK
jgi:hypothetical protein